MIENLAIIIHYHWVHDTSIFSIKRQQVQFIFIMLLIVYTESRLRALMNIESEDEFKSKELQYQDFELILFRDFKNLAVHILIMHAVLHHMKDREENEKLYVSDRFARRDFTDITRISYMFWQWDDSLTFCLIIMFLSLIFVDDVIDAKTDIYSSTDLFLKKVSWNLNAFRISWKSNIEKKSVLLASQVFKCFQVCSD